MSCFGKQICYMIQALAVIAAGILVTSNQIAGNILRHLGSPLIIFNIMIQLHEIIAQLQRSIKGIEHIACMILNNARVGRNPICRTVGIFHSVRHAAENTLKPNAARLIRICLISSLEFCINIGILTALPLRADTAQHHTFDILTID